MLYILNNKTGKIKPFTDSIKKTKSEKMLITKIKNKNICGRIVVTDSNYNMVFKVE